MSVYDTTESHTQDNTVNPTSGVTLNKYRNQIACRRSKVKELLTRIMHNMKSPIYCT